MDDFKLSMLILTIALLAGAGIGIAIYQSVLNFAK
jgi:hypothetical protein